MSKKIKHAIFKRPIMATVKLLGMYQGLTWNSMRQLFIWLYFGLPFLPIFMYKKNIENEVSSKLLVIYFPLYLIQTFFLGKYIAKIGRQWTLKEYEQLTSDQVIFPFILTLGIYSLIQFFLFMYLNNVL